MVLVAINKSTGPTTADLIVSHPVELTRGRSFRITAATPAVVPGPALAPTARNSFRLELPPSSVTTIVLER
jgi:O-glycosyl hydrolase